MKGLLFDKDGTLFNFQATWGRWAGQVIDHFALDNDHALKLADVFDYNWEAREFHPTSPLIAGGDFSFLPKFLELLPHLEQGEVLMQLKSRGEAVELAPVCDLPKLFHILGADFKIGLATNDREENARKQLKRSDILEQFDFVAGNNSGFGSKPDAGMCLAFAEKMGLAPSDCAMIGDTNHDFRAGKAAGMTTIGVCTGPATRADLEPLADYVLDSIEELPAFLKTL